MKMHEYEITSVLKVHAHMVLQGFSRFPMVNMHSLIDFSFFFLLHIFTSLTGTKQRQTCSITMFCGTDSVQ